MLPLFIRMGLYFNVRQLLLKGLEKVSSSKIPFLHSMVTKIVPNLDLTNGEGVQQQFRLAGDLVGRQPLVIYIYQTPLQLSYMIYFFIEHVLFNSISDKISLRVITGKIVVCSKWVFNYLNISSN